MNLDRECFYLCKSRKERIIFSFESSFLKKLNLKICVNIQLFYLNIMKYLKKKNIMKKIFFIIKFFGIRIHYAL